MKKNLAELSWTTLVAVLAVLAVLVLVFSTWFLVTNTAPKHQAQSVNHPVIGPEHHPQATSKPVPGATGATLWNERQGRVARKQASLSSADSQPLEIFSQLLRDYRSGDLSQDDKTSILDALRDMNRSSIGRSFIVTTFYSAKDPELAEAMYGLILDADLKDPSLIVELIARDKTEHDLESKIRIIDLIADLNSREGAPYAREIDEFLANLALSSSQNLSNAAKSQRAWYVTGHQQGDDAVLNEYLLDQSPDIRREMYEVIEANAFQNDLSERLDLTLSLTSLLHADYLGVSRQEEERIAGLIQKLGGDGSN